MLSKGQKIAAGVTVVGTGLLALLWGSGDAKADEHKGGLIPTPPDTPPVPDDTPPVIDDTPPDGPPEDLSTYVIASGDTPDSVASAQGVTVDDIKANNPTMKFGSLVGGQPPWSFSTALDTWKYPGETHGDGSIVTRNVAFTRTAGTTGGGSYAVYYTGEDIVGMPGHYVYFPGGRSVPPLPASSSNPDSARLYGDGNQWVAPWYTGLSINL